MDYIKDSSLVLDLPLYELDGASFMSKDAYGHLCTVTGALWTPGGGLLDGTDDNINLGNVAVLNFERTSPFSALVWLKRTATGANHFILGKRGSATPWRGWNLEFSATDNLVVALVNDVGTVNYIVVTSNGTFTDTASFVHIGVTYSGSSAASGVIMYVNGSVVADTDTTDSLTATMQSTNNFAIGCRNAAVSLPYKGTIGDVLVHNRALTAGEVQHNYLATRWRYA